MKSKEKQQRELMVPKQKVEASSSDDDEDSDEEKNFALLTKRGDIGGVIEEPDHLGEGEEDCSDEEEETEEESNGRNEDSDEGSEEEVSDGQEEEGESCEISEEDGNDEDDGDDEIQTQEDIRKELSNMPFEDIIKLQNQVGTKVYNEVAYSNKKSRDARKKKRLNKNRPMEISAKKPAPFIRQVVSVKKPAIRDPRFDDLSGEYKPEIFEKTYKFINDIKHKEKEIVQERLKRMKESSQNKEKLQFLLKRLSTLPALVGLPPDFPSLEIERAHRALAPAPDPGKPPRSVLVWFVKFPQREAVLRAALKKRDIQHGGSQLRFYPDLSSEVLRKRREFDTVRRALAQLNKYHGFAYPACLRCLHEGRIRLFDTPESATLFLDSKQGEPGASETEPRAAEGERAGVQETAERTGPPGRSSVLPQKI